MTDHNYEATVETDGVTFTFKGDQPQTVSAQAARMPVVMHNCQVNQRIDLSTPVFEYLERIAEEEVEE